MAWRRRDPAGLAGAAPLDADSGWRAPPVKLTPNQERFVQEYLINRGREDSHDSSVAATV
jgi:hypothetical protein